MDDLNFFHSFGVRCLRVGLMLRGRSGILGLTKYTIVEERKQLSSRRELLQRYCDLCNYHSVVRLAPQGTRLRRLVLL